MRDRFTDRQDLKPADFDSTILRIPYKRTVAPYTYHLGWGESARYKI